MLNWANRWLEAIFQMQNLTGAYDYPSASEAPNIDKWGQWKLANTFSRCCRSTDG